MNESPDLSSAWPTSGRQKRTTAKSGRRLLPRQRTTAKNASETGSKKPSRDRRNELLRRLEVDPEELASSPQITPLLRQNGITSDKLVEVLRCDGAPESAAFVAVWDDLTPISRSLAGIEAMAIAAEITPRRLYEVFAGAAMMQSRESVALTIALNLPDVMRVTVKEAKKPKGHYAREHVLKAGRVLPVPKGSTTVIQVGKQIAEQSEDSEENSDDFEDLQHADDFMMQAAKVMGTKALPAPKEDDVPSSAG